MANCEYYNEFATTFYKYMLVKKYHPETLKSFGETPDAFVLNILAGLRDGRIFELTEPIKKLLALTKTPKINSNIKLPFQYVFLDVGFTKDEFKEYGIETKYAERVVGILVSQGILRYKCATCGTETDGTGNGLRISIMSYLQNGEVWWDTFNKDLNLDEKIKCSGCGFEPPNRTIEVKTNPNTDQNVRDFCHRFFLNFLNFLNNPDVNYVWLVRSQKNTERRLKENKPPLPMSAQIRISGYLNKYLGELSSHRNFTYGYRFWIRGHFRTLTAKRYKAKLGQRIWIPPFLKGSGLIFKKPYLVEEKDETEN